MIGIFQEQPSRFNLHNDPGVEIRAFPGLRAVAVEINVNF